MDEPRSNIETAQPLLSDQNEVEAAWDADVENSRPDASENDLSVEGLMGKPSHNVLKFLQTSGVQKIAEFTAPDDVVFGAFGDTPILTFGAESKYIDAEREWNDRMCRLVNKKSHQAKSKSVPKAFTNQVAVEAYVVPIQRAAGSGSQGIIQPLLRLWQAKRCSFAVFSLPAIQSVIFFKWETFARKLLIAELAVYCLWVFAFYSFTAALQDEDLSLSLSELLQSSRGRFTVGSEIVALVAMTPFLLLEAGTIVAYGWAWVRDPSNSLDLATYALQTVITIQHLGRVWLQSSWLTYCLALQCILLTFRLQYFTQVLRPMRFSFTNVVREVLAEVRWMLLFIFVTCTGFGAAMHITFRKEEKPPEEFESFPRSVLAAFEHLYGDLQLKYFVHSQYPVR